MGFMHTGQRDQIWCRISKKAFEAGFRLKHLGTILHAKLHDEYGGIVDKVAVTHHHRAGRGRRSWSSAPAEPSASATTASPA